MTDKRTNELIAECKRQEESCLYTSTSLYIWLRSIRWRRKVLILAPIILGGIASWSILKRLDVEWVVWLTAVCALLAGLFPAIHKALDLDVHIDEIREQAASFKNLQDRFRQASNIGASESIETFEANFEALMSRLERVRKASVTAPERYFKKAQKKIDDGHYSFSETSNASKK